MAARAVFHVVPSAVGWNIKHNGRVLETYSTKAVAVPRAVAYAKANEPSQVVVHRSDGTIDTEWTYGNDPFPPAG